MQKNQSSILNSIKYRYLPYWPVFVLFVVICIVCAYIYVSITPPVYKASATMSIKDERKGVEDSKLLESLNVYAEKTIVENETEVLHSRTLMKDVIKNLHLYAPVAEEGRYRALSAYNTSPITIEAQIPEKIVGMDTVKVPFVFNKNTNGHIHIGAKSYALNEWVNTPYGILKFERNTRQTALPKGPLFFSLLNIEQLTNVMLLNLEVSTSSKGSTVIDLIYKDEAPKRAEDVLNSLIDTYNKASVKEKNVFAESTLKILDDRLLQVGNELTDIEGKIQQYRTEKGVVDLSEQSRVYLQNVGISDQKASDISMQMAVLDQIDKFAKSTGDNGEIPVPSTAGIIDPALNVMVENLYSSELEYEKQKKISGENNPIVTGLKDRIERTRVNIQSNIRAQKNSLAASRKDIAATTGSFNSTLQTIPQKEKELLAINRQQAIKSGVYSFLLQKREETALTLASAVADSRVVDTAKADLFPESPKKSFAYLAALIAALGLGIAFVSAKELFSNKVLFRSDIEDYSDMPVVAELTNVKSSDVIAINSPNNLYITEQFRHLRASIGLFSNKQMKRKILVTSSITGEGKSFVSSNLAVSLAATRKKVVLVDLDMRNPKTSEIFKVHKSTGTINYLEGNCTIDEVLSQTDYPNLFVIPVGTGEGDPAELLLDEKLNTLFQHLENQFDYIIIDTAPVDPVADAYLLTEYCDMTLFVVRHGYTPKATIQSLETSGKIKDLKNPMIVFNSVKGRGIFKKGYGNGYGYGNRYQYQDSVYKTKAITNS